MPYIKRLNVVVIKEFTDKEGMDMVVVAEVGDLFLEKKYTIPAKWMEGLEDDDLEDDDLDYWNKALDRAMGSTKDDKPQTPKMRL